MEYLNYFRIFASKDIQMEEFKKSNRTESADSIIKNHMIWSMGAGFIPIPIADLFAVSAIQLDMIRQLAKLYEIDFKQTEGKALISALTGTGLARLGARAVKFIPGVGSILGGVTLAILSGASSYALGEVFKRHFETGGTFLDFDPSRLKKYYDEKFEKGKEVAKEIQNEQKTKEKNANSSTLIDKLKDLADMKEKGLISADEFEEFKKKLLS
ncbi:MAG TPA: DUF697 domain-containing protein [Saprospiraceae bacterium]|nr:DUF697 domain-containing protein [Saprospiraceae bacterium]